MTVSPAGGAVSARTATVRPATVASAAITLPPSTACPPGRGSGEKARTGWDEMTGLTMMTSSVWPGVATWAASASRLFSAAALPASTTEASSDSASS